MGNNVQNNTQQSAKKASVVDQVYRGAQTGQLHGSSRSLEAGWAADSAAHFERKQRIQDLPKPGKGVSH